MKRRMPDGAIHQYSPVDTPGAVEGFLDYWRPELGIFVESDVWPNLVLAARTRGVRLALVSARLSDKSLKGWERFSGAARDLFGAYDLVMAQDDACAERLARLGARDDGRLNLKMAGDPLPVDETELQRTRKAIGTRPVLLAASTHPGEDDLVLEAFEALKDRRERPLLVLAPRHPMRAPDIVALCEARGLAYVRRSLDEPLSPTTEVLIADTLGELGLWFRLAAASLVAGSLVPGIGGHNPLEPARLGSPIVSGRHVANWGAVYRALDAEGAVEWVEDGPALKAAFERALDGAPELAARAEAARRIAGGEETSLEGAAQRLAQLLEAPA
jgi:3-deoxy-D-manno-octulosonic-acid transferase